MTGALEATKAGQIGLNPGQQDSARHEAGGVERRYRGRFAPSPTGPLHRGSLVTALASWLDARAAGGSWIIRIEDLDPLRAVPGVDRTIIEALANHGLESDEPVIAQSARGPAYEAAFAQLQSLGLIYGCSCSRKEIDSANHAQAAQATGVYPGTCATHVTQKPIRAYRVRVPDQQIELVDRAMGPYSQQLKRDAGDFVIKRADGSWAYQLAVVVDDAAQQITDVVRGADLLDNTPRQIFLQRALGWSTPRYLHVPVVLNDAGEKLSKQAGASALDAEHPLQELEMAAQHLRLGTIGATTVDAFLAAGIEAWKEKHTTHQGVS